MGILHRFKNWLTASKRPIEALGHPDLYPIDIEQITIELDLLEKAKDLGQKGLPAPDAKMLTGSEADIVRTIERHRQGNVNWAVRRLAVLSEAMSKQQMTLQVNQARQADEEFNRKANLRLADFEARLRASGMQARVHQEELESFRALNRLTRQSRHQSALRSILALAIVGIFILIEGAANATLFAQGLDGGWLEGLVIAMLFAAVNVVLAFVVGKYLLRQLFHRSWPRKFVGIAGAALGLLSVGCMALLTTHYRDSLTAGVENAATVAFRSVIVQPLMFSDIFSVILCVLSVGFGVAAMVDGLFSDDLYPGYGSASRRAQKSLEEYEADLAEAREELEQLKEGALAEFDGIVSRSRGVIASLQNCIEDKRTTASRLSTAMHDVDHSLSALLRRFRTENEKHRGGVPRPAYFDEYPALTQVPLPNFDIEPDLASLETRRNMVEALVAEAQDIRARIQASFSQQFDSLKTLDANFTNKEGT